MENDFRKRVGTLKGAKSHGVKSQPCLLSVAARGEIGREGCEISSLVEHMGLSPWLFL